MEELVGITYARSARELGTENRGNSVRNQQLELEKYALENKIRLIRNFSDVGYSGNSLDRPGLFAMFDFLKNESQHVDVLLIQSGSRLSRNSNNYLRLHREIIKRVDRIIGIQDKSQGYNMIQILGLIACTDTSRRTIAKHDESLTKHVLSHSLCNFKEVKRMHLTPLLSANRLNKV